MKLVQKGNKVWDQQWTVCSVSFKCEPFLKRRSSLSEGFRKKESGFYTKTKACVFFHLLITCCITKVL